MQDKSNRPPEQARNEDARLAIPGKTPSLRSLVMSIIGAFVLLFWDIALMGELCGLSLLICPIWFLVSIIKNAIQRPGWTLALIRVAIPVLTLGLVVANYNIQYRIAESNASRIIAACEEFRTANDRLPKTLDELVPKYLQSIPRAKYCLLPDEFRYYNDEEHPFLVWRVFGFYRKIYHFEDRRWSSLD